MKNIILNPESCSTEIIRKTEKMLYELRTVFEYWLIKCRENTIKKRLKLYDMFSKTTENSLMYGELTIIPKDIDDIFTVEYNYIIKNKYYCIDTCRLVIEKINNNEKENYIDMSNFQKQDMYGDFDYAGDNIREDINIIVKRLYDFVKGADKE